MEPDGRIITFLLGEELYAFDILSVQEVIPVPDTTRVPFQPDYIIGVTNLRGEVLCVLDLARFLDLPATAHAHQNRVVVTEEGEIRMGFLVDSVVGVRFLDPEQIMIPQEGSGGKAVHFASGLLSGESEVILLLDLERIVSSEEIKILQEKR